ncbi:recombination-associated protein RdgC [Candidatus Williamhamiltonella defendens]|uniref:Recombination-associated protein RdgC n=1 Tax=Candidatus Williamhamiltonella defendens TaxID=138072 RepID=A0A2D3SZQ6_9ENTR|nr:recombination-associated protein RdgC [Candidatus Hamiltonella defensa]ATW29032.1 recombination-associated protein RdgC [Candidatus Hamiltonella defensa]ATW30999.1 recombination-associated protein RdgC [Candidatus Hamiltonella defensa]
MIWFKNLMMYQLQCPLEKDSSELEKKLANFAFIPCGPQEKVRVGWIPPMVSHKDTLSYQVNRQILLCAHKEEKMLPASVIKQELERQIEKLEAQQKRKLKKTEKASLKDHVFYDLLPRAFSRFQKTWIWIDTIHQMMILDASSTKRAEEALALLRQSLGSLAVVPFTFKHPVEFILTEWIRSDNLPSGFVLMEEAELKSTLTEGGTIRCKNQNLYSDEIALHIKSGKKVTRLALEWQESIQLILNQDLSLKRVKFLEVLREKNSHINKKEVAQCFDADFVLMTYELTELIKNMMSAFSRYPE